VIGITILSPADGRNIFSRLRANGNSVPAITAGRCLISETVRTVSGSSRPIAQQEECMNANVGANDVRELSATEVDMVSGGLDIGPLHVAAGDGVLTVGLFGVGIFIGEGCVGVYGGGKAVGVCV
jgi:hypothetical protein